MRREKHIFLKNGSGIFFAAGLDMISDKAKLLPRSAALSAVLGMRRNSDRDRNRQRANQGVTYEHTPWFGLSPTSGQ
jgi:hypothetical protein